MKNEVNRAFMAKKKNYNAPHLEVSQITLAGMIMDVSPVVPLKPHPGAPPYNPNVQASNPYNPNTPG